MARSDMSVNRAASGIAWALLAIAGCSNQEGGAVGAGGLVLLEVP